MAFSKLITSYQSKGYDPNSLFIVDKDMSCLLYTSISKILEQLYKSGNKISIRPHPRYSNMDIVKKIFTFADVEDTTQISIEQSLLQSGAAISLYSTVLNQALCNSIPIIIDNMSNPENFNKLKELGYVCLYKKHRLLSEVLEKSV